jgi:hypothetical protein
MPVTNKSMYLWTWSTKNSFYLTCLNFNELLSPEVAAYYAAFDFQLFLCLRCNKYNKMFKNKLNCVLYFGAYYKIKFETILHFFLTEFFIKFFFLRFKSTFEKIYFFVVFSLLQINFFLCFQIILMRWYKKSNHNHTSKHNYQTFYICFLLHINFNHNFYQTRI